MASHTLPLRDQRLNAVKLATALGVGVFTIYAVKKANRLLADQQKEELIFAGRTSTPAKVSAWLESHPHFVARQILAKTKAPHDTP